jgi:hypothetical protein
MAERREPKRPQANIVRTFLGARNLKAEKVPKAERKELMGKVKKQFKQKTAEFKAARRKAKEK